MRSILMEVDTQRNFVTRGIGVIRSIRARLKRHGGGTGRNGGGTIVTRGGLANNGIHGSEVDGWLAHNGI